MAFSRLAVFLFGLSTSASAAAIQVEVIPNFVGADQWSAGIGLGYSW